METSLENLTQNCLKMVKLGSDIVRVLYFFCEGRIVVLTNGFVKKTQKTPENEIRMAKKYRSEYLKRSKTNG